ncbi:PTS sugar transporter subunit IIA [Suttonella ornithocola]|uniref:EIIAB-Man n=1 Tax=Suttonella ornithocola TaxID=279832 RepID=A0A380MQ84_9GAMM|nr:PTS sugar transporter subunit IIA [Suttonella ornithocola]SUO94472.1 EIIAB-Man [Suttonella ornithocola]
MYFIICGHGKFAEGLYSGANLLYGKLENCQAINFDEDTPHSIFKEKLAKAVEDAGDLPILFFTDILGGTPFRECATLSANLIQAEVISGSNLQMLVEAAIERENATDIAAFAANIIERAKAGIIMLSAQSTRRTSKTTESGI